MKKKLSRMGIVLALSVFVALRGLEWVKMSGL